MEIVTHIFECNKPAPDIAAYLTQQAKSRGIASAQLAVWRLSGHPLVSTMTQTESFDDGTIVVRFFDETVDLSDFDQASPVILWVLKPLFDDRTLTTASCDDERFQPELNRLLAMFNQVRLTTLETTSASRNVMNDEREEDGVDYQTKLSLEAVRGWPEARKQGVKRRDYVAKYHISESTLTRWRNKLEMRGFNVPDFSSASP